VITPHRKTKVTYNDPGHVHFVTYTCFGRYRLLEKDRSRQWVIEALDTARRKFDFALWAYVVMPEHVHLLLYPRAGDYRMANILAALKRPVSKKAKDYLTETSATAWLQRLTVREGKTNVFRFWLPGGGYDRNLCGERPLAEVIAYIHANPVRRGLVSHPEAWYWSSARFWAGDATGPLAMDPLEW
jgi:putative transposase